MKEYVFPISKAFENGLRKEIFSAGNLDVLITSMNALAGRDGLKRLSELTSAYPSIAVDFPFPQVYFLREFILLGTSAGLYEMQDDGTWLKVIDHVVSDAWEVLDFGPYVIASNLGRIWNRNVDTGVYDVNTTFPTSVALENFKGQIISAGDLDTTAVYSRKIFWSKIGSADFTVDRRNQAGFTELFDSGPVRTITAQEKGFFVYSENQVNWFFPVQTPVHTFGRSIVKNAGVAGKGSVAKGLGRDLVLLSDGNLYEAADGKLTYVGFKEFFDSFGPARITYDPVEDRFYISNGSLTYVYSEGKLGELGQVVTSGGMYEGAFYVMTSPFATTEFEVVTGKFDMGVRGQKTLYAIALSVDAETDVELAVDWRTSIRDAFRRTKFIPVGPTGIATIPVTGVEFRIAIRAQGEGDVNLSKLNIRWKLTDKRAVRGPYGGTNAG